MKEDKKEILRKSENIAKERIRKEVSKKTKKEKINKIKEKPKKEINLDKRLFNSMIIRTVIITISIICLIVIFTLLNKKSFIIQNKRQEIDIKRYKYNKKEVDEFKKFLEKKD